MKKVIYFSGFTIYGLVSISIIICAGFIYNVSEVGLLSLVVSIQYFISQINALGIHFSTLFYESLPDTKSKFSNHFLNVLISSVVISSLICFFYNFIVELAGIKALNQFRFYIFFWGIISSTNKVFINYLNAKKKYYYLGTIFGFKGLFVAFFLMYFFFNNIALKNYIFFSFLLPELLIFILSCLLAIQLFSKQTILDFKKYFKQDLSFGSKSFWGALFLDSSIKLDVLLLAMLTNAINLFLFTV